MKLTFLGTGASTPSKERNLSSVNLNFNGFNYLFDCPEGTQRQMMHAKVSYLKISHIFLSHFHGDHILGLPGLLATMSMHQRDYPLKVFGPKGVKEKVKQALELSMLNVNFEILAKEVKEGLVEERETFNVTAFKAKHEVPCYGYVFKEKDSLGKFNRKKALELGIPEGPLFSRLQKGEKVKVKGKTFSPEMVLDAGKKKIGKKVSIVPDTLPLNSCIKFIHESDVLVHESTFLEEHRARAKQTFHSTAKQAAEIAKKAECGKLFLTHLSARQKDSQKFENEARTVFAESTVAEDLMQVEVK